MRVLDGVVSTTHANHQPSSTVAAKAGVLTQETQGKITRIWLRAKVLQNQGLLELYMQRTQQESVLLAEQSALLAE
jgi:hypothetical protein